MFSCLLVKCFPQSTNMFYPNSIEIVNSDRFVPMFYVDDDDKAIHLMTMVGEIYFQIHVYHE